MLEKYLPQVSGSKTRNYEEPAAHRGRNTLRAWNLTVSACVDRTNAANHTCSFTDACVGGCESKATENE